MNKQLPINRVMPLTVKTSANRHHAFRSGAVAHGVPVEDIEFFAGHAAKDFDDDMQAVARAAADDGFPFIYEYARGTITQFTQQTAASVSQVWNVARFLRWLKDADETVLFLWDDKMITVPYDFLLHVTQELISRGNFHLIQLRIREEVEAVIYKAPPEASLFAEHKNYFKAIVHRQIISYADLFLDKGMQGYDESFIINSAGAKWMLDTLASVKGYFVFFDHCLAKAFPKKAEKAIETGKGIYVPKTPGFNFVDEPLHYGTETNWAPEGTLHYQESIARDEILFTKEVL